MECAAKFHMVEILAPCCAVGIHSRGFLYATGIAYLDDVFVFQGFFRFRTDLSTDISVVIKEFNEI